METDTFALTLYVPDETAREMGTDGAIQALLLGWPDLDFLRPGWWEGSHTARLGVVGFAGPAKQGAADGPDDTDTL